MTRAAIAKAGRVLVVPAACLLMVSCAVQQQPDAPGSGAGASVQDQTATRLSAWRGREKAIISYRDYLERYPDGTEYDSITRRLADLLVEQAADMQLTAATSQSDSTRLDAAARQSYDEAIRYYEYLLDKYPDGAETTDLLYQLSRAYEESGQSQQALKSIDQLLAQESVSNIRLYADTRFRRAELLFEEGAYLEAGQSYQAVVNLGPSVPAYEQALYKLGWSLFKQERYTEALPVLFTFLDLKIPSGEVFAAQLPWLSPADREQTADVFHVVSMSFAQLGGVDAVDVFFRHHGSRSYADHVYLGLAEFYVEQDQVTEAARTWRLLAQRAPLEPQAPRLTARAISLYRQAGFQQRVVETEAVFANTYGMNGSFWTVHAPQDFPDVLQVLQSSLQELASVSHERARKTREADDVRVAEQWYRKYLATFGTEEGAAEMNFQLAELLYENGEYRQAIDAYEQAAWSFGDYPRAADAALGALRASEKLLQDATAADRVAVAGRATASALRFVQAYPDHPAAPALLAKTGASLLEQQHYDTAVLASEQVFAAVPAAPPVLRQIAWSIQAQAQYELGNYPVAAEAYRSALQLADRDDPRRLALQKGLATATFKQAEQMSTLGDKRAAVALYQQAAQLAPAASIESKAHYEAATVLLSQESWAEAIRILEQFRRDYPDDPLQAEVTRKLAYAYDRNGNSTRAATEYLRLGQDRRQADTLQREALLRAADIYAQTGDVGQAISTRELYLERFPQPAAAAVEVMQQLADLAGNDGNAGRRQHWLEEIIALDRKAGNARTRVIAAEAMLELAENRRVKFGQVQLVNPVQQTLARKLQVMKQSLQLFEAAIGYGVPPVTTAANYQVASMYEELGQALLTSERPASLTADELAEYNLLLAEQAAPFAQQAIDFHMMNAQRSGNDQHDPWVAKSVQRLEELQDGQ
jgi:tetratricopeptide (TPR) repeat protein